MPGVFWNYILIVCSIITSQKCFPKITCWKIQFTSNFKNTIFGGLRKSRKTTSANCTKFYNSNSIIVVKLIKYVEEIFTRYIKIRIINDHVLKMTYWRGVGANFNISKIKTWVVIEGVGTTEILDGYVLVIWSKIIVIFCTTVKKNSFKNWVFYFP
jgi:hypothetical protein